MALGNIFENPTFGSTLGAVDPLGRAIHKKDPLNLFDKKSPPSTFAQDTYAAVTKDQWYSYLNEIGVPQEMALQKFATDPSVVTNAMAEAGADVNKAFDRQQAANQRNLSSLGLTLSADEKASADRSSNLARSLADINAMNMARRSTRALQQSVLGNPAPMIGEP